MIKIEGTVYKNRYNLVDTEKTSSENYYIRELSKDDVIELLSSIITTLLKEG